MEQWEAYALGAIGILIVGSSLMAQVAAFMAGDVYMALASAFGVVAGVAVYRYGYRLLTR